jgi:hypothetical protein
MLDRNRAASLSDRLLVFFHYPAESDHGPAGPPKVMKPPVARALLRAAFTLL